LTLPKDKKTRTAPPEVRRQQLIDATLTCVSQHGISGTTLTAVTKEAGVSLGLVNFHFKSKDILLAETLNYLAQEHRLLWMTAVNRSDLLPEDKLRAIVDAQFHPRICSRKKLAVWFAFYGDAAHRETYRKTSSQIDMERQEVCANLCADIIAGGNVEGLTVDDAEEIALTLEGLFDGLWLNMLLYPAKFSRKQASRQVLAYLNMVFPPTRGLAKHPAGQ